MNADERVAALKSRLVAIRKSKKKSRNWLVMKTGISKNAFVNLESDGKNATIRTLLAYCDALKIDLVALLEEVGCE